MQDDRAAPAGPGVEHAHGAVRAPDEPQAPARVGQRRRHPVGGVEARGRVVRRDATEGRRAVVGRLGDDRDAAIGGGDDGAVAVVEEEVRPARRVQRRVRARGRRHERELEEGQRVQRDRVEEVEGRALVEVRAGPLQPAPTVEGQGDAGAAELGRERPRPAPERPPVLRVGVRLPRVVVDAVERVARHERVRPGRAHAGERPGRGGVADEPGRRGRRARRRDRVRRLHLRAGRDGGERGEQQDRHDGGGDGSHGRHRASLATAATTPGRPRFGRPYTRPIAAPGRARRCGRWFDGRMRDAASPRT